MSSFSTPAISEAGKATALAVVLALAAVYLPLAGPLLLFLLPLPLAFVTLRRGLRVGAAAAVGAGVLAAVLTGPGNGLLTLLLGGLVGLTLGTALHRQWSLSTNLLTGTLAAALALSVSAGVGWLLSGMSVAQMQAVFDQSMKAATDMYRSMGMQQATIDAAEQSVRQIMQVLPYLLPTMIAIAGLSFAAVSLALAGTIFPRVGQPLARLLALAELRLHWSLAYGFIAGLGLVVAAPLVQHADAVRLVGLNLLVFFMALFFVQGLALAHWYAESRRLSTGSRALLYTAAVVGELTFQLTSWAGLLDTWFDYRKRFKPRDSGPQTTAPVKPGSNSDQED